MEIKYKAMAEKSLILACLSDGKSLSKYRLQKKIYEFSGSKTLHKKTINKLIDEFIEKKILYKTGTGYKLTDDAIERLSNLSVYFEGMKPNKLDCAATSKGIKQILIGSIELDKLQDNLDKYIKKIDEKESKDPKKFKRFASRHEKNYNKNI